MEPVLIEPFSKEYRLRREDNNRERQIAADVRQNVMFVTFEKARVQLRYGAPLV